MGPLEKVFRFSVGTIHRERGGWTIDRQGTSQHGMLAAPGLGATKGYMPVEIERNPQVQDSAGGPQVSNPLSANPLPKGIHTR